MEVCEKSERKVYFVLTIFLIFSLSGVFAWDSGDFVTTWKTDVPGATESTKVTLNFPKADNSKYEVSWECNGVFEEINDIKVTHDYQRTGTFDICVKSNDPLRFYAPDLAEDEKAKLQEIKQWGNITWSSFKEAFKDMINVQLTATDVPNLSQVTDMSYAFGGATNFIGNDSMNSWNTSQVKNMASMFRDAKAFNRYIGGWNTGAATSMAYMFNGATNFNNGEAPGESHNTMN